MADGQKPPPGPEGPANEGAVEDAPVEAPDDELEARRRAQQLPVDQQALNIIGLAQARERLRASRAGTMKDAEDEGGEAEADDDHEAELQRSVDRHPAARFRDRTRKP
jgi:hypothetical protein